MRRLGSLPHLCFVLLCAALAAASQYTGVGWVLRVEMAIQDAMMRAGRITPADPALVFLAVDTASATLDPEHDLEQLFDPAETEPDARRALELMAH